MDKKKIFQNDVKNLSLEITENGFAAYLTIKETGQILNAEEEAEEFITFYEGVMDDITEKTAGLSEADKPRIFYEDGMFCPKNYMTFTRKMGQLQTQVALAGGINIAAGQPGGGFVQVDPEWVMKQNPDVIVRRGVPMGSFPGIGYHIDDLADIQAKRSGIMNRPELAQVRAVEDGRVYVYYLGISRNPRIFVGLAYMAKWFHPELFQDLDPEAIHQEYLTRFMRIDYDLSKQGVFVYPEP